MGVIPVPESAEPLPSARASRSTGERGEEIALPELRHSQDCRGYEMWFKEPFRREEYKRSETHEQKMSTGAAASSSSPPLGPQVPPGVVAIPRPPPGSPPRGRGSAAGEAVAAAEDVVIEMYTHEHTVVLAGDVTLAGPVQPDEEPLAAEEGGPQRAWEPPKSGSDTSPDTEELRRRGDEEHRAEEPSERGADTLPESEEVRPREKRELAGLGDEPRAAVHQPADLVIDISSTEEGDDRDVDAEAVAGAPPESPRVQIIHYERALDSSSPV